MFQQADSTWGQKCLQCGCKQLKWTNHTGLWIENKIHNLRKCSMIKSYYKAGRSISMTGGDDTGNELKYSVFSIQHCTAFTLSGSLAVILIKRIFDKQVAHALKCAMLTITSMDKTGNRSCVLLIEDSHSTASKEMLRLTV